MSQDSALSFSCNKQSPIGNLFPAVAAEVRLQGKFRKSPLHGLGCSDASLAFSEVLSDTCSKGERWWKVIYNTGFMKPDDVRRKIGDLSNHGWADLTISQPCNLWGNPRLTVTLMISESLSQPTVSRSPGGKGAHLPPSTRKMPHATGSQERFADAGIESIACLKVPNPIVLGAIPSVVVYNVSHTCWIHMDIFYCPPFGIKKYRISTVQLGIASL